MRIHLVVNVSWVVRYIKQVEEQKVEVLKLVEINRVKEWEVEKIFNKKTRGIVKYLLQYKRFITENDT